MKTFHHISSLPRATWILPLLLLVGCPSGDDGHEGHDHKAGQAHEESQGSESADDHAGHDHDHDEESSN